MYLPVRCATHLTEDHFKDSSPQDRETGSIADKRDIGFPNKGTGYGSGSLLDGESTTTRTVQDIVHTPVQARATPAGATAKCGDGTYSFSERNSHFG